MSTISNAKISLTLILDNGIIAELFVKIQYRRENDMKMKKA